MFLSQTRQNVAHKIKGLVFDKWKFQELVELRHKELLEASMGFCGQLDEHRRFQFALLKDRGLRPNHQLLEIGCGPLTGGLPLIDYLQSGNYIGVDVRESVLNLAWKEIGKSNLSAKNPRLIFSSSFGKVELGEQTFDFILSFSVLYHLSDELLSSYFKTVKEKLKAEGVCFANVNTESESSSWLEFPFLKRTIEEYIQIAGNCGLATESLGRLHDLGFRLTGAERHNQLLSFKLG